MCRRDGQCRIVFIGGEALGVRQLAVAFCKAHKYWNKNEGASKLAHFHEKVGIVKHPSIIFEESPPWRAHIVCANERNDLLL